MVYSRKKIINGKAYYYAIRSFKVNGKVKKTERYIGKHKPTKESLNMINPFVSSYLDESEIEIINQIRDNFETSRNNLPKSIRGKNLKGFLIKFTYNTNRIEGSTLTLLETKMIIDDKLTPKGKPLDDIKEVENHIKAFNYILTYKKDVKLDFVKGINGILLKDIKDDIAGLIRKFNVEIFGSKFTPPHFGELSIHINSFFENYQKSKKLHPFERAVLSHLKLVSIHPFGDGNGRTARLLMNFILKQYGYPMLDISYSDREDYYSSLQKCQLGNIEKPFIDYCYKEYVKQNKEFLKIK